MMPVKFTDYISREMVRTVNIYHQCASTTIKVVSFSITIFKRHP